MHRYVKNRDFMKSRFAVMSGEIADQAKGIDAPPNQLPHETTALRIALPGPDPEVVVHSSIFACLKNRRSRREWSGESLTKQELGFLLWATQGIDHSVSRDNATLRPVPSGGARHPFETYLLINRIAGIEPGVYRYLPVSHELVFLFASKDARKDLSDAVMGQMFVVDSAVVFLWSCVPYRSEWRYGNAAHRIMLLDAGHIAQNLYLACEAIGVGTCVVGAFDQSAIDDFLGCDGQNEYVVYLATVGRIPTT